MADNFIQSSNTTPKIPEANDSPTVLKLAGEPQNISTAIPESAPDVGLSNVDLATISSPPIIENVGSPWKNKLEKSSTSLGEMMAANPIVEMESNLTVGGLKEVG